MSDGAALSDDIVVFCDHERSRLNSHYFFSLVFGHQIKFRRFIKRAVPPKVPVWRAKMLVFNPDAFDSSWLDLLRSSAAVADAPFLLCFKREYDPVRVESLFATGANEVITLPISLTELAYRLRARCAEIGLSFNFDLEQARALDVGADVVRRADLTDFEAQVMLVLMERGGEVVSRDALSLAIDNKPWSYGDRKFDVHIARIRRKLNSAYGSGLSLRTVRSAGYQLTVQDVD